MIRELLGELLLRVRPRPRPASARELFDVWAREMGAAWPEEAWRHPNVRRAWYAVALRASGLSVAAIERKPPAPPRVA